MSHSSKTWNSWSWQDISRHLWMILATIGVVVVLIVLVSPPAFLVSPADVSPAPREAELEPLDVVRVVGPGRIFIRPDTPFATRKLSLVTAASETKSFPMLTVTGAVVARSDADEPDPEDRWQFSTADLQALYTDWIKSEAEVRFAERQLAKVQELQEARLAHHESVVNRLRGLVRAGTDAPRELIAAEAEQLQAELEGGREIHEQEQAFAQAQRDRASLERQLLQAGVPPRLLRTTEDEVLIAVADVPEVYIPLVHVGQACRVRFYGYVGTRFDGEVKAISPSLSDERRTLRVLFEMQDPPASLIPGMFAEIDLGTDMRDVMLLPTEAVLHVGQTDYVLVRSTDEEEIWEVRPVRVGQPRGQQIEILSGLQEGEEVIGHGMILMKPFVVRALATP